MNSKRFALCATCVFLSLICSLAFTAVSSAAVIVYDGVGGGGVELDINENWVGDVRPTGTDIGTIAIDVTMDGSSAYNPAGATFNQTGNLNFDNNSFNIHTDATYNLSAGSMTNISVFNKNGVSIVFNMSGGTITATADNYFNGAILNMLAGAGTITSTTLGGSNGTINIETGWTGSYTADNYDSTTNWETLFVSGIAGVDGKLNGATINLATFNTNFAVTNNGKTLTLVPEPNAICLLAIGLIGMCALGRRKRCYAKA